MYIYIYIYIYLNITPSRMLIRYLSPIPPPLYCNKFAKNLVTKSIFLLIPLVPFLLSVVSCAVALKRQVQSSMYINICIVIIAVLLLNS